VHYFAYFNIFDIFPQTRDDVDFSLLTRFTSHNHQAGWIGPAGTFTGYHFDWPDNIFAQVVGSKEIRMVSPDQSDKMYPTEKFDYLTRQSAVDVDRYDSGKYPRFAEVEELSVILQRGELIFIPSQWWHCIRSREFSISVNNFGYTLSGGLRNGLPEFGRLILHQLGWYQKNNCCCHMIQDGRRVAK
ncbi:MAG: cupin-like domain-containing protein, partial [Verrucomicrobiales bacterium]